jgi:hypothetical protein
MNMQSDQLDKLAEGLAKAQGAMSAAEKGRVNPFFKSKYADLSDVWDACRKPLSDNGLAVIQITVGNKTDIQIETTLLHKSGQFIKGLIPVLQGKQDMQGLGAAITYARRFSLAAMVGVYQDDNDGNGSSNGNAADADADADAGILGFDERMSNFIKICIKGVEKKSKTKEEMLEFMATRMEMTNEVKEIINIVKVK